VGPFYDKRRERIPKKIFNMKKKRKNTQEEDQGQDGNKKLGKMSHRRRSCRKTDADERIGCKAIHIQWKRLRTKKTSEAVRTRLDEVPVASPCFFVRAQI
jgi:hypothetical protein